MFAIVIRRALALTLLLPLAGCNPDVGCAFRDCRSGGWILGEPSPGIIRVQWPQGDGAPAIDDATYRVYVSPGASPHLPITLDRYDVDFHDVSGRTIPELEVAPRNLPSLVKVEATETQVPIDVYRPALTEYGAQALAAQPNGEAVVISARVILFGSDRTGKALEITFNVPIKFERQPQPA